MNLISKIKKFSSHLGLCLALASFAPILTSCGKNGSVSPVQNIVKDVTLTTSIENGDMFINLGLLISIGNVVMTSVTLPIVNPMDPSKQYGSVSFKPTMQSGVNELLLKANLSQATSLKGGARATLPNGQALPIGGLEGVDVLELAIDQIHSKIYIALTKTKTLFGFAIAIKEFDAVQHSLPNANIFLGFNIKNVIGMVGLFTGSNSMENGLAAFIDLSSVFNGDILTKLVNHEPITQSDMATASNKAVSDMRADYGSSRDEIQRDFKGTELDSHTARVLSKELLKLNNKTLHYIRNQ